MSLPQLSPAVATVVDLFEHAVSSAPNQPILRCKVDGEWQRTTFLQWREISRQWAKALVALGVQHGDRVLIVGQTCREWLWLDIAVLLAGGVTVPVYPSATADEARWIAADSGARVALVEDAQQAAKLATDGGLAGELAHVLCWTPSEANGLPDVQDWHALAGRAAAVTDLTLDGRSRAVQAEAPCTIVYTSGTTGRPKGVVLSHAAFVFEVRACMGSLDVRSDDALLLFLPLAHSFAKLVYVVCVGVRCEMCIPESMATLIRDLPEAAPTVMPSVPRVFEKLYTKILAGVDTAGPVRKQAFAAALAVGRKVSALRQRGEEPTGLLKVQHQLAERLVFSRIHTLLGGRIRAFISGGAPLSKELAEFFHACGLTILEGYGMTENCAAATVNRLDDFRLGTVGKPIPGVEVAIAADCEVLIRGGNIMTSYWRNPEATAAALDRDGWLHTGDIGEVDADGFLRITDRKKDLIITAGGKNVAPQNLEAHLKTSRYISNCLVYGDRRKFLTALITLDEDAVAVWARERGLQWSSHAELSQHAEVFRLLQAVVDDKNRALASYETVKKFAILERDFDVEAGELTPSLKLRRREIVTRHLGLLDSFYTEHY